MNKLSKKTVFLLLCLMATVTCMAQHLNRSADIHTYYGTTTSVGSLDTYQGRVALGTFQGVTLDRYGDVGISLDAVMYTHYYKGDGIRFTALPYLEARPAYPLNNNFSVMGDVGIGYSIPCINHKSGTKGDLFTQFGLGVKSHRTIFACGIQSYGTGSGSTTFYVKLGLAIGKQK